jgi:hypothetical protein
VTGLKLVAVTALSLLVVVLGVIESLGEIWLKPVEAMLCGAGSSFRGALSDALEDALLRGSLALYAFSPCVSLDSGQSRF